MLLSLSQRGIEPQYHATGRRPLSDRSDDRAGRRDFLGGRLWRLLRFVKGFYPDWDDAYCKDLLRRFRLGDPRAVEFGFGQVLDLVFELEHPAYPLVKSEHFSGVHGVVE